MSKSQCPIMIKTGQECNQGITRLSFVDFSMGDIANLSSNARLLTVSKNYVSKNFIWIHKWIFDNFILILLCRCFKWCKIQITWWCLVICKICVCGNSNNKWCRCKWWCNYSKKITRWTWKQSPSWNTFFLNLKNITKMTKSIIRYWKLLRSS